MTFVIDDEITGLRATRHADPIWSDATGSDFATPIQLVNFGPFGAEAGRVAQDGDALIRYVLSTNVPAQFGDAIPFLCFISGGPTELTASDRTPSTADVIEEIHEKSGLTWDQIARALAVSKRTVLLWARGSKVNSKNLESIMSLKQLIDSIPGDAEARRTALLAASSSSASRLNEWARGNSARTTRVNAPTLPPTSLMG